MASSWLKKVVARSAVKMRGKTKKYKNKQICELKDIQAAANAQEAAQGKIVLPICLTSLPRA
jgi:hypothetical protein